MSFKKVFTLLSALAPSLFGQLLQVQKVEVQDSEVRIDHKSSSDNYYILQGLDLPSAADGPFVDMQLGASGSGRLIDDSVVSKEFYRVLGFSQENPSDVDGDQIDDVYELGDPLLNPFDPEDADDTITIDGTPTTQLDVYLNNYEVGRGMFDITGVAADGAMMGYAAMEQVTKGIHDRQWARAFVVKDRKPPYRRVAHVVVDNGQVFQSIYQGVFDKIRADDELKDHYSYENIVLSATHTHGAAGGHSHFALYHAITGGYQWRNYDAMVHGVYMAIKKAHRDLKPGAIKRNRGHLVNANENRRPNAFLQNIEHNFPSLLGNPFELEGDDLNNRDTEMTLLRFEHQGTGPIAMFNWFPVHGVSVSKLNKLLTGDNKGNAAYLFEKSNGAVYPGYPTYDPDTSTFVAGFANSNPGDLTANRRATESPWPEPRDGNGDELSEYSGSFDSDDDFGRAETVGGRQLTKALNLYNGTDGQLAKVTGAIDYRHMYVDMNAVAVNPNNVYPYNVEGVSFPGTTNTDIWTTCQGALGIAFASGTKDGEGMDLTFLQALAGIFSDPCQTPKTVIATTASNGAGGLTPHWMPISILRVGDFAILAVPGEFTTMAGYRLRKTVENAFAAEGQRVRAVLSGLSNSYSGYVTTYEEYVYEEREGNAPPKQGYEAASTHFGAFTLAAYQTKFAEMATAIAQGTNPPSAPNLVTMSSAVRSEEIDPTPTDKLAVLDVAPLPDAVAAAYEEDAGCPTGQFHIVGTPDCWSCPTSYQQALIVTTSADACEIPAFSTFQAAIQHGNPGCPTGSEFDLIDGGSCWSCPSGFNRTIFPVNGGSACERPAFSEFTSAMSQAATGGVTCPFGWARVGSTCYKCPATYAKNILRAWTASNACEKSQLQTTSATDGGAGTGFFGTDCPSGFVLNIPNGRCYKCPASYAKNVLRAWTAGNACERTAILTTSASTQGATNPTTCPAGYALLNNTCYKCPNGFNKVIFNAWTSSSACEKVTPATFTSATKLGSGNLFCPAGQTLDLATGKCYSCPAGSNKTILQEWNSNFACETVTPRQTTAANRQGKFACEVRNPAWFLDIGLNECWSCPAGSIRNFNPVDGGAACTRSRTFGDPRTNPNASYNKGQTMSASFWSGHPKNVFGTFDDGLTNGVASFFKVQRKSGPNWITIRTDADWDTRFDWTPSGLSGSATFSWTISNDIPSGTYRILHEGYRSVIGGVEAYSGTSSEFQVN